MSTSRLPEEIFYALSMYFADTLKRHLLAYREDGWTWLFLVTLFGLYAKWSPLRHPVPKDGDKPDPPPGLHHEIAHEAYLLIRRTLAFLVLQVTIHLVVERGPGTGASGLWHETLLLPCVLLLLGLVVVTLAKHVHRSHASQS